MAARDRSVFGNEGADERSLADGQVAWSWPPDAEVKFALVLTHHGNDGGQQARRTGEIAKQP
ncbi:hypothetical protein ACQR16_24370 [Bradyrhizobium oligotrophicum]|uniref:hypothetical protein n=1 Tax=Bradyrhizobium oligotrophicum TaxID=44255 RepID=UPI003EC0E52E